MLAFLAIWFTASNHCYLEMAGIVGPDQCHENEQASSSNSDPCETGCKLVEKAAFKTENNRTVVALVPLIACLIDLSVETSRVSTNAEIHFWPPDTLQLPQFVITTALPIRGPSFVS